MIEETPVEALFGPLNARPVTQGLTEEEFDRAVAALAELADNGTISSGRYRELHKELVRRRDLHRDNLAELASGKTVADLAEFGCRIDAYGGRFAQAHRGMLDMFARTEAIRDAAAQRIRVDPASASGADLRDWDDAQRELAVMRGFVELLAEAYGVEV